MRTVYQGETMELSRRELELLSRAVDVMIIETKYDIENEEKGATWELVYELQALETRVDEELRKL